MPFVSMANAVPGSIASSAEYNKVVANVNQLNSTRTFYKRAACSSDTTVGTSDSDLAGTTLSFTTLEANTVIRVTAVFDISSTQAGDIFIGSLAVDGGSNQTGEAHYQAVGRSTVTQTWIITIATAGSHNVRLRVRKNNNGGTVTAFATHSSIVMEGQGVT